MFYFIITFILKLVLAVREKYFRGGGGNFQTFPYIKILLVINKGDIISSDSFCTFIIPSDLGEKHP